MTTSEMRIDEEPILKEYGCKLHYPDDPPLVYEALDTNLYHYKAFFGIHNIHVPTHSTLFYKLNGVWGDMMCAVTGATHTRVDSTSFAVLITGYMLNMKTAEIGDKFNLPYVNGCCTKQIMQPERMGDPTVQLLRIPAFSAEQAHHIHSTVRVVHILEGEGKALVGMEKKTLHVPLFKGMSMVLEPMCPHHFETADKALVCLPIHVFSSSGAMENNHPMFNGTFMMNHGVG